MPWNIFYVENISSKKQTECIVVTGIRFYGLTHDCAND